MDIYEIAKQIGPVFPVDSAPDKKKPLHTGWQEEATRNPEGMEFPKGVGIKTGLSDKTNLVVIDTDNDAAEEYLTKNLTEEELGTYTVKTRRGKHRYYWADPEDDFRNKIGLVVHGLDVKANGGYIISPPSEGYSVLHDIPIAPLPIYLKDLIGMYERKTHGLSQEEIDNFTISNSDILWELLREIYPGLDRNEWIKVLSIAKH